MTLKKRALTYLAIVGAVWILLFIFKAAWHVFFIALGVGALIFLMHSIEAYISDKEGKLP